MPRACCLITDEGHHLESAATSAMSFRTSRSEIEHLVSDLGTPNSGWIGRLLTDIQPSLSDDAYDGLLEVGDKLAGKTEQLMPELRNLFDCLKHFMDDAREGKPLTGYGQQLRLIPAARSADGWDEIEIVWSNCESLLKSICKRVNKILKAVDEIDSGELDEDTLEDYSMLKGSAEKLLQIHDTLENVFMEQDNEQICWLDINGNSGRLTINSAPVTVGPLLRDTLWNEKDCVILTSATLTAAGHFDYMKERLSAEDADEMRVGSPFDYEKSVLLCTPNDLPDPNAPSAQHVLEQTLINLCRAVDGRTLVLFTAYAQLKRTSNAVTPELEKAGITVFEQGEGVSPSALLKTFRETEKAVLLGTRSFWEGVDIQGDALSVVVIAKLPFSVPSDPIVAARSETFDDPFNEYSVPEAILKFRQGFGRLIRSRSDRGLVVIMDNRVVTKRYGQQFLNSIPKCTRCSNSVRDLPRLARKWLDQG